MSFSSEIKIELSKVNNFKRKEELYAEFYGYISTNNVIIKNNKYKFSTENEYNINRFAKILSNINIDYDISIYSNVYYVVFKNEDDISKLNLNNENEKKSFIRGAFLGSGSINNPNNQYHLEINFSNNKYANLSADILKNFNIKAKILNNSGILYIKDGDDISKFLALIGANSSVLKFEQIRVIKDMKNNINRVVNCETANLNKVINTSVEQIACIKKLKKIKKFELLPQELKELANLREKNPNATLEQLGKMMKKPVSKSTISHRFTKIKIEAEN